MLAVFSLASTFTYVIKIYKSDWIGTFPKNINSSCENSCPLPDSQSNKKFQQTPAINYSFK